MDLYQWFDVVTYVYANDDIEDEAKNKLRALPYFQRYMEIHRSDTWRSIA